MSIFILYIVHYDEERLSLHLSLCVMHHLRVMVMAVNATMWSKPDMVGSASPTSVSSFLERCT